MSCRAVLVALSGLALSACSIEPVSRSPGGEGEAHFESPRSSSALSDADGCRVTASKGCFDGHIVSKAEFQVEGLSFFNAADFAARFCELIEVASSGAKVNACQGAKLVLLTPVDSQNFATGFEYYMQGVSPRSGKLRNNGDFNVHELAEGSYRLRMQKPIHFTLSRMDDGSPQEKSGDAAPPSTRNLCATLYADADVDVRRGKRSWENFNEFKLYITDKECPVRGAGLSVHL